MPRSDRRLSRTLKVRKSATALALLLLLSCGASEAQKGGATQIYKIAGEGQQPVEIAIDPVNKGLRSELPWRLGVAFNMQELRSFFAPAAIPVSPKLLEKLEAAESTMHRLGGCNGFVGDSPVSMVYHPSKDHAVRSFVENQRRTGTYQFQASPKPIHGLMDFGPVRHTPNGKYFGSHILRLPQDRPFGFHMQCGLLDAEPEGGCTVTRDLAKNVSIEYGFCESMLPNWREIDNLYFEISSRIIKNPKLSSSYRLGIN